MRPSSPWRRSIVEVVADGLEVGVARAAAPLGGDDLAAPLGDPLDLGRRAERAGHGSHRRRSASQPSHVSSGRSIATPSAASRSDEPGAHHLALLGRRLRDLAGLQRGRALGVVVGPDPAPGVLPGLQQARDERVALVAAAQPLRPRLAVHAVRALLLEDLLRALGHRRQRRVDAGGDERRQHAVDQQVGGDERVPVRQLVVEQREPAVAAEALVADVGAELLEHRIGRARVAELVLRHRGRGDGGLERRGGHRPLRVAAAERRLVVGQRAHERLHGLIASRIAARGTMIMWIHGCSS